MSIVFGQLKSFANIVLSGPGAISPVKTAWPLEYTAEYDTSLLPVGKVYPFDAQGTGPAPFKALPTLTYEYIILADYGLSDALAFKQLRTRWNQIYAALQGTYTWGSATGTSGQKGTLVVYDEDPTVVTTYSATARILKPGPWQLVKGQPSALEIQLSFALLSDFS